MQSIAKFQLQDWFNIIDRGLVIAGQIIEGEITAGNCVCINDKTIKIKSVEIGDKRPNSFFIGLILETKDQSGLLPFLKKLKGKNLAIITATII